MSREPKGLVGNVYEMKILHSSNVGDTREHDDVEKLGKCWCWEDFN